MARWPPLAGGHDATVRCVIMSWPVINPLGRYRYARNEMAKPNPPDWAKTIMPRQDKYWQSEAAMGEGSPLLILERGEKVKTPPAFWLQGKGDVLHDYIDPDGASGKTEAPRFIDLYRKAGGEIELNYFEMESAHTGHSPDLSKRHPDYQKMIGFIRRTVK